MEEPQVRPAITVGGGGWLRVHDRDRGVTAFVRMDRAPDGRLYPGAMTVQAQEPDDSRVRPLRGVDLRAFPLAYIEAQANGDLREQILDRLDDKISLVFQPKDDAAGTTEPPTYTATATSTLPALGQAAAGGRPDGGLRLTVPETRPYPDEFYREVAAAYIWFARTTKRPAAEIAERAGAPVKTVHGWVGEARKRGHLAPGRRGKAG